MITKNGNILIIEFCPKHLFSQFLKQLWFYINGFYKFKYILDIFTQLFHFYKDEFIEESEKEYEWQLLIFPFRVYYLKYK